MFAGAEADTCWEGVGRQMHQGGAHGESIETSDTIPQVLISNRLLQVIFSNHLPQVIRSRRTGHRALSHSVGFHCQVRL